MELNSNQIAELMPHRYPFALVDRITAGEPGQWAKGVKCVTVNEPFFCGHFPQEHVMPGVLILEAMAQVGCVAFLAQPENRGRIVTVDALCMAAWRGENLGYENTLMVHMRRLREKIEPDPSHPRYLITMRGLGYRLLKEDGR